MKPVPLLVLFLGVSFVSAAWGQQPTGKCSNDWSEFHRTNMQRWDPCEKVLNVKNVGNLVLKWQSDAGGSQAAIVNGVVYVGSVGGTVSALDASTGSARWTSKTYGSVYSAPAVADGIVTLAR
jgi:outer membrane protein assembly factor BamB